MLNEVRDWNGVLHKLRSETFWHLTPEDGLIKHNARVGKGVVYSISFLAGEPGLTGIQSPHSFARQGDAREMAWEATRALAFSAKPSRSKAFFCFDSEEVATRAGIEWFAREPPRTPLKVRIGESALIHRGDTMHLEAPHEDWTSAATRYWNGEMTTAPFPELIVHGVFYFPDWEQFPLAF